MTTLITIQGTDEMSASRSDINTNFSNLNTDKIENDSSDTLTNKTINLANNTVTGTTAEFNTALSDGSFATGGGTATGTNTGDQTITLTGDVTGSGTGSFAATIASDAVTYDKMQDTTATDKILGRSTAGAGTIEEIDCTAAGRALLDDADASAQRTTLNVDVAGTDNSTDVTLAGTPDYITISGQVITRNAIDLANDVTGNLPVTNLNSGTSASATTFWRGDGTWATPAGGGGSSSAPQFAVNVDGVQIVGELYTYVVNSAVTAGTFRASLKTKPTGADFIIKLYKNGVEDASITIATTDTATNGLFQATDTSFVSGSYAAGDVLTVEVTQIGSTVAGADLTFSLFE